MVPLGLLSNFELAFSLALQILFGFLSLKFHCLSPLEHCFITLWFRRLFVCKFWIVKYQFLVKIETLTIVIGFAAKVIYMVTLFMLFLIYCRLICLLPDIRIFLKINNAILLFLWLYLIQNIFRVVMCPRSSLDFLWQDLLTWTVLLDVVIATGFLRHRILVNTGTYFGYNAFLSRCIFINTLSHSLSQMCLISFGHFKLRVLHGNFTTLDFVFSRAAFS